MKVHGKRLFLCILPLLVAALLLSTGIAAAHGDEEHGETQGGALVFPGAHKPVWNLKGTNPFLIGGYGDNFNYDGTRVTPLAGKATVRADADRDAGTIMFTVYGTINPEKGKVYTGEITVYYRITKEGPVYQEGGIADFVYLHGDTGQGHPVMPKTRTFLASWGPANIYINGKLVYQGLDGHMMFTERTRDPVSQVVYNADGSGFFSPKEPANGSIVDPNGRELHFVAHSMKEDKGNFPPNTVFLHVSFQRVADRTSSGGSPCLAGGCGHASGGKGFNKASCGIVGCGCGCASGGPCGCVAGGKVSGKATCGVAGCGCGCADGGPCGCVAGGKSYGKATTCGVAGCGCGCASGGPCSCVAGESSAACGCVAGGKGFGKASCGIADCGCGCADGGPCGCVAGGKGFGKASCGIAGCGCGCADGGPCGCVAGGKVSGKTTCGVAGCGCGCVDGGPCGCVAGESSGETPPEPPGAPRFKTE